MRLDRVFESPPGLTYAGALFWRWQFVERDRLTRKGIDQPLIGCHQAALLAFCQRHVQTVIDTTEASSTYSIDRERHEPARPRHLRYRFACAAPPAFDPFSPPPRAFRPDRKFLWQLAPIARGGVERARRRMQCRYSCYHCCHCDALNQCRLSLRTVSSDGSRVQDCYATEPPAFP